MEEKHRDLVAAKQKKLINTIVAKLSELHPSLYYSSTSEIAYEVERYVESGGGLKHEEAEVLKGLSRNDIQMILSLHND